MAFNVPLPDGHEVDICSKEGANAFLLSYPPEIFYLNLYSVISSNGRNADQIGEIYKVFRLIAANASLDVFELRVPIAFLKALIDHVIAIFRDIESLDTWKRTGILYTNDQALLETLVYFSRHKSFSQICIRKRSILQQISNLCASRIKPNMIGRPVAEALLCLTCSVVATLDYEGMEFGIDEIFKRVESLGVLAQCIRASTVPLTSDPVMTPNCLQLLDALSRCDRLIRTKLFEGSTTGRVLRDVLRGDDGYTGPQPRNSDIMSRLQHLALMSDIANLGNYTGTQSGCCYECGKSQNEMPDGQALFNCKRCKMACYCSKECQTMDWESHKLICRPLDSKFSKYFSPRESKSENEKVDFFINRNYRAIMERIAQKLKSDPQLKKRDLMLEIDYFHDSCKAPAFRNQFEIKIVRRVLDGADPIDEPDWFHKGYVEYETKVRDFRQNLRYAYAFVTDQELICTTRFTVGTSVRRLKCLSPETRHSLFSDEVVRKFIEDDHIEDNRSGLERLRLGQIIAPRLFSIQESDDTVQAD